MSPRILPILAALLIAGVPSSPVLAQQVFLGDPVDPSGRPFPMMPGLPLLLPGDDGEFGTADDVHDPSYSGDVDLVVRVGTLSGATVPAPTGAPGGPALMTSIAGGGITGQGQEVPFTLLVTDGSGDPPYGNPLRLADLDTRPFAVFAFADLDGDGVVGPRDADGAEDNAVELQEASAFVGRQVGALWEGRAQGSLGLQIAAPASIGGLTVVLVAGAYTGTDPNDLHSDGTPILTRWPFFPPLGSADVIGGENYGTTDPSIRSEIMFDMSQNYLPEDALLGPLFALPVDGTEPSTDQVIVVSGPASGAGFFEAIDPAAFRPTSRMRVRPAPNAAGSGRALVAPVEHLVLAAAPGPGRILRLLPVDLFGNVADPDDPNTGYTVELVGAGGVIISSPDSDGLLTYESIALTSAAGVEVTILDFGLPGQARIDLLQGSRVLGSLPVGLSGGPDTDADGIQDDGSLSGLAGDLHCTPGDVTNGTACDDNCPLVFNPSQTDRDQDGVGNCCDGTCVTDASEQGCAECTGGGGDLCAGLGGDTDGDLVCDEGGPGFCAGGATENCKDNCPTIANTEQIDTDGDGVGDECDNCTLVFNPRVAAVEAWMTLTGGQRDDDGDRYGNKCDGKFSEQGTHVTQSDVLELIPSMGEHRESFTCGSSGIDSCARYDLDEGTATNIGQPDIEIFLGLLGELPGPSCDDCCACPTSCSGPNCPP